MDRIDTHHHCRRAYYFALGLYKGSVGEVGE